MGIMDVLPRPEAGSGRRATEFVTDRIERGAETVEDVSRQVRDTAHDRVSETASNVADSLAERIVDDPETLLDPESHGIEDGTDALADRALEGFLRRYGLAEDRLDDRTVESIRERLAAEFDADRAFEALAADGSAEFRASERREVPTDRVLADLRTELRSELGIDPDQPLGETIEEVLSKDAVGVAHGVERAVTDALQGDSPSNGLEASGTGERSETDGAIGAAGTADASGPLGGSGTSEPTERGPHRSVDPEGTVRPTAAAALVAAALVGSGIDADSGDSTLFELVGALLDSEGSSDRLIAEALSALAASEEAGGAEGPLDPETIRSVLGSDRTGARALATLFVANLVAMTAGAVLSRRRAPPIPEEIRGPDGEVIVTDEAVRAGKKDFQANGLMNHGSILGNGAYFGVDLTADALGLKVEYMREYYARDRGADSFADLPEEEQAAVAERVERELDAEAPESEVLEYSAAEVYAHRRIREAYVERYHGGDPDRGIPEGYVPSPAAAERIADFACWTAWMAHTDRPGSDHSYTNDWPYVPGAGNRPTGQVMVWSTISLLVLVGGGGLGVWAYHAFDFAEPATEVVDVPSPDEVSITPAQYAAGWYVPVAGALFVAQVLAGALLAHYYVERTGFFGIGDALGIDLVSLVPFSTGRTWHINLAVLWITTLWLAGGLFLPGLFTDGDPPGQATATFVLLATLVLTTVGAFAGVWLGTQGKLGSPEEGELWWWLGSEGLEYLEVGRFWKLLLLAGFGAWTGLVLRSVRRIEESPTGLGHFLTYAGGSIALMFAASMLYTPETNIAVTEFWRWWVVHMWVEGVFEFFVTAVVSVALVSMNLLEKADAETAILFETFAIMAAGIVGVSHHYWWVGLPDHWIPIGTTFSTLEFVPLIFVLYRSFGEYRSMRAQGDSFPYSLPLLFIVGSSVWNFVGGGVLGFFINLPAINYFEHGTYLTVAHGHAATFGAFGLLALGLGTYVLQMITPEAAWEPGWFRGAFWLTNVGLAAMTVASLLPIGFLQLETAYSEGYDAARSLEFYERPRIQTLLWARTLGDTPMILGALAFTAGAIRNLRAARKEGVAEG